MPGVGVRTYEPEFLPVGVANSNRLGFSRDSWRSSSLSDSPPMNVPGGAPEYLGSAL